MDTHTHKKKVVHLITDMCNGNVQIKLVYVTCSDQVLLYQPVKWSVPSPLCDQSTVQASVYTGSWGPLGLGNTLEDWCLLALVEKGGGGGWSVGSSPAGSPCWRYLELRPETPVHHCPGCTFEAAPYFRESGFTSCKKMFLLFVCLLFCIHLHCSQHHRNRRKHINKPIKTKLPVSSVSQWLQSSTLNFLQLQYVVVSS